MSRCCYGIIETIVMMRVSGTFLVHDPEPILAKNGQNIKVGSGRLEEISNKRGLVIWQGQL